MASAPEGIFRPPPNLEQLIATIHGNCVFSDADYPVKIDHLPGRAVVGSVGSKDTGKIHFPLPMVLDSGEQKSSPLVYQGWPEWLEVDFDQVKSGTPITDQPSCIIKAEVFVGCNLCWSLDLTEYTSFKVQLNKKVGQMSLKDPKGLEVTLTIKFGGDRLQFCSVALFGSLLGQPGGPIRPGD